MGMFDKAPKSATPAPKKKGKEKPQINIPGLQQLTVLDALIKKATALQATIKAEVCEHGFEKYAEMAGKTLDRPSSFEGIDGLATASVEFKKRSTASVLTDEEAKVLREAGFEPEEKVVQPFLFHINSKYVNDKSLLAKVEKALEKIVPEDFIEQQQEVTKLVVNDACLDEAFRRGAAPEILRMLTTIAIKPKFSEEYNMDSLLSDAMEILKGEGLLKDALTPPTKQKTPTPATKVTPPGKQATTKAKRTGTK